MPYRVEIAPEAAKEIEEIYLYIAQDSPGNAAGAAGAGITIKEGGDFYAPHFFLARIAPFLVHIKDDRRDRDTRCFLNFRNRSRAGQGVA